MTTLQDYLTKAIKLNASDLHISAGIPPIARINGELVPLLQTNTTALATHELAKSITTQSELEMLEQNKEIDFAYEINGIGRFRINIFMQKGTYAISARVLNTHIPTPNELLLPKSVINMCNKKRGLVLVTGVTGSGKSTTLASLINQINQTQKKHIITLEDPIEYVHEHNKSIVNQRELKKDTNSFANALRAALRQDPDVIFVGEMRDLETIAIAITAAETGHLVFSTLHTMGASSTVERIVDVFEVHQQQQIRTQLAQVLECVVSQQLVPTANLKGRIAAFEVMVANSAIRSYIREAKTHLIPSAMQTGAILGMKTMDDALFDLYLSGDITPNTAIEHAQNGAELIKRINN